VRGKYATPPTTTTLISQILRQSIGPPKAYRLTFVLSNSPSLPAAFSITQTKNALIITFDFLNVRRQQNNKHPGTPCHSYEHEHIQ